MRRISKWLWIGSCLFAIATVHAQSTGGSSSACGGTNQPPCATAAQDAAAKSAQALFDGMAQPQVDVTPGGETGAGVVHLNGTTIDSNKLAPGASKTKADNAAQLANSAHNLTALKAASDAQVQADGTDSTLAGEAWNTTQRSAKPAVEQQKQLMADNAFWTNSLSAISQARAGNAGGQAVGTCTTSSSATPTSTTYYTTEEKVCDIVQSPSNSPVCTRSFQWQAGQSIVQQNQSASLPVDAEANGAVCSRDVTVTGTTNFVDQSKIVPLLYPDEVGGNVCTRTRWPDTVPTWVPESFTGTVDVNTEVGGQVCTRQRWVTGNTSAVPGFHDAGLNIDLETSKNICTRVRQPTATTSTVNLSQPATLNINMSGSSTVVGSAWQWPTSGTTQVPGSTEGDLGIDPGVSGQMCTKTITPVANNSTQAGTYSTTLTVDTEYPHNLCTRTITPSQHTVETAYSQAGALGIDTESSQTMCTRSRVPSYTNSNTNQSQAVTLTAWPNESNGVLQTLQDWPTISNGPPTQVNSAATSQSANTGFDYDPTGAHSGTVTMDLSGVVPAGETSISGFALTTVCSARSTGPNNQNPYAIINCTGDASGLSMAVTVSQVPSAANNWVAKFAWADSGATSTSKLFTVAINASWTANAYTSNPPHSQSFSVGQRGGQSGTVQLTVGSATTITNVTAYAACTSSGTCGVIKATGTGFYIPMSVTVTQQPTAANNWVLGYTYTPLANCDNYNGCTGASTVTLTVEWLDGNVNTTNWSVVTANGPVVAGPNPQCTTAWSCSQSAPATVNGVSVTGAMASALPPLFSGAGAQCIAAKDTQTCSGSITVSTTVNISSYLPANTTAVNNFAFTVSNPQTGVTVALASAPTAANNWIATFNVTKSGNWTSAAVAPQLALTWTSVQTVITWAVADTGNCNSSGTSNCPVSWGCTQEPPATLNGISVTGAMVSGLATLFPGADATCLAGTLSSTCGGTQTTVTSLSIAAQIPAGTTTIDSFAYSVSNPQTGVSIALASAPSSANNWVATFNVTRTSWTSVPAQPNITMTWNVPTVVTDTTVKDIGNCNDPGTANCPATWSCGSSAPTTVNGISVTAAIAATDAPLYPGAANTCVIGSLDAKCSGSATNTTTVNLSGQVPAGTTALNNFAFTVSNPQNGVTVTLSSAPTAANNWVATFTVTRTDFTYVPVAPNITMTWTAAITNVTSSVVTVGTCGSAGTTSCSLAWSCTAMAPTTINGVTVDTTMANSYAPLYPGANYACAAASLASTCSTNGSLSTSISIASLLPSGTTSIAGFTFNVTNPQNGVTVTLTQTPDATNNWTATFAVTRSDWSYVPVAPHVALSWNAGAPNVTFAIQTSGDTTTTGTAQCPASWSCTLQAPATVNGVYVTPSMLASQPLLYPGASSSCLSANLTEICGSLDATTQVSIAAQLPAGTTAISNFGFAVVNPQTGVTVTLTQTPDASNNWVAIFDVNRAASATGAVAPQVTLTWQVQQTTYSYQITDTGTCTGTQDDASCPLNWSCTTAPPATINGVYVTAAALAGQPPLYPGDSVECLIGSFDRACSGPGTVTTQVSIAGDLPAGTTSIQDVAFTVTNVQTGVTVAMTDAPTLANNWVATFTVSKSDWTTLFNPPQVHITWNMNVQTYQYTANDTGNCNATGDAACPTTWSCAAMAPATINGINLTPQMLTSAPPLFPGADTSCVTGNLTATCGGSAVTTSTLDITTSLPAGTTTIQNVQLVVNNPQPGVTVQLITAPSAANNWIATIQTTRSDFTYVPVRPSVTINYQALQNNTLTFSVKDTGDCTSTGSTYCPTTWSCTAEPPQTINGVNVTASMVSGLPALFPGADATCLTGALTANCSGMSTVSSPVSIADTIPAGVTAIQNFNWSVNNPQPGVTITLTQLPSLANNWVATFSVSRDYSVAATASQPFLTLTWQAVTGTVSLGTIDTGTCNDTVTASCSPSWSCKTAAPATIDGVNITAAMLQAQSIQLYPADSPAQCLSASLSRTCSGQGATTDPVSIAGQLPQGTTQISNFAWTVSTPAPGVTVSLLSAPTAANGWVATFQTTRSDWNVLPTGLPVVNMTWVVNTGQGQSLVAVDTGDCSVTGDSFCGTQWMCTAYASTPPTNGGSSETDVSGSASQTLTGSNAGKNVTVSIASQIPAGTSNLTNVSWLDTGAGTGASATLTTPPSLSNNWTATFHVISPCSRDDTGLYCEPDTGTLSWVAIVPGTSSAPPPGAITTANLVGMPPLYSGAPPNCIAAQKVYQCNTINNGQVCHTAADGSQVCDNVVGGQFDGCAALRTDPTCTYERSICTEGATSSSGFCYIMNQVFACRTPVQATDTQITTTTQCNMNVPVCTTAGCNTPYTEQGSSSQASATHAVANLALIEDAVSDYSDGNPPPPPPPGGTGGTGGGGTGGGGTGGGGTGGGGTGSGTGGQVQATMVHAASLAAPMTATSSSSTSTSSGTSSGSTSGNGTGGVPATNWTPWTSPPDDDTPSNPNISPAMPPGWNPAKMSFFNGNSMSCFKALGGLLNCCSKAAPVDGNVAWWKIYQSKLRSGWAGVAACTAAPAGQQQPPGGWASMGANASMSNVSQGFTSALENLTGNGVIPACQSSTTQTMQSVENQFEAYANQNIIPKLAWYCGTPEETLAIRKRLGECEYLGDYCKTSVFGVCLDKRQRYCCFNSQMSKMLREQLKKQGIVGFGTAKHPSCQGITYAQLQKMNASSLDTTQLEGNMVEAGAVPNMNQLLSDQFLQTFTGSGSDIGNAGRQDTATRTASRVAQVKTTDTVVSLVNQTEQFVPDPNTVTQPTPGPGEITIQNATVSVTRGSFFDVLVTRTGGAGAVSIQVTAVDGSATHGIDYAFVPNPQTLTWGTGDTSTRKIRVYTYAPYPVVTVARAFQILLSNPTGGATIYPTGEQDITINPKPQ